MPAKTISVQQYADDEGINLTTAYRRIKAGKVPVIFEVKRIIRVVQQPKSNAR